MDKPGIRGACFLALAVAATLACAAPPAASRATAPAGADGATAATAGSGQARDSMPAAQPVVALRYGLNTTGSSVAPIWVAREEGIFARYGLDVEPVIIPGPERITAALMSGELQLTGIAAPSIINASLGGADLVFLASYNNQVRFKLYARPEIASVSDLRGKLLAITSRGGILKQATDFVLERHGLDPERDVAMFSVGTMNDSVIALLSGNVDAALQGPPGIFVVEDEGMRLLADLADYQYMAVMQGVAARRSWVDQNEDLARRMIQGLAEGIAFVHKHPQRTKEVIGQYTQSDDQRLLDRTYTALLSHWERTLRVPPEALRKDLESVALEVPAARGARPEQFIDNRLVDELEREGFPQRLYQ